MRSKLPSVGVSDKLPVENKLNCRVFSKSPTGVFRAIQDEVTIEGRKKPRSSIENLNEVIDVVRRDLSSSKS